MKEVFYMFSKVSVWQKYQLEMLNGVKDEQLIKEYAYEEENWLWSARNMVFDMYARVLDVWEYQTIAKQCRDVK